VSRPRGAGPGQLRELTIGGHRGAHPAPLPGQANSPGSSGASTALRGGALLSNPSTAAAMFWAGGAFACVSVLPLERWPGHSVVVLVILAWVCSAGCGVRLAARRALPPWTLHVDTALATGVISVLGTIGETPHVDFVDLYVWIGIFSALYFPPRAVFAHVSGAGFAYATVLALRPMTSDPVIDWLAVFGPVTVAAAVVSVLVAELRRTASHDPLTGLANRALFDHALGHALVRRRGAGRCAVLVIIDVDDFKAVNDRYGHSTGDALLCEVAYRLRSLVRGADTVARLGGDEFALVLDDADPHTALALAERVTSAMREPFMVAGVEIAAGVSAGVHIPEPGDALDQVIRHADAALYAVKAAGGGWELFDAARHHQFVDRYQLELELRAAPGRGEFVLHYQPIVELATRRTVGVEALIRWNHPTRGLLNPLEFIEIAEESGAIIQIGRWVIRQACADARSWQERIPGAKHVGVAVNVSRRQLQSPHLLVDVSDALGVSGLPAASLTVEITETVLMADTAEIVRVLDKLKAFGVILALDDFGTGYSSLSQLRALPIDVLKIDKAFVDGIALEDEEWALAAAIIRLAVSLHKRTLAEGVENASQLAHLRSLGCELAQGYLFARPMALADLEQVLASPPSPT